MYACAYTVLLSEVHNLNINVIDWDLSKVSSNQTEWGMGKNSRRPTGPSSPPQSQPACLDLPSVFIAPNAILPRRSVFLRRAMASVRRGTHLSVRPLGALKSSPRRGSLNNKSRSHTRRKTHFARNPGPLYGLPGLGVPKIFKSKSKLWLTSDPWQSPCHCIHLLIGIVKTWTPISGTFLHKNTGLSKSREWIILILCIKQQISGS